MPYIHRFLCAVLLVVVPLLARESDRDIPEEVTFISSDSLTIYGDLYVDGDDRTSPMVLLFHQAGSCARGEYATIIPRLRKAGYAVLAIDQRSGGSRLGGTNRTVAANNSAEAGYCEAYADLEAALTFVSARGFRGPRFAWGSSYSAALVVRLGAEHGESLAGVLAFSPASGDPMGECQPGPYIDRLAIPALILRPAREMEIDKVRDQLARFAAAGHRTHVAADGVHGSSMLNPERAGNVDETWSVVLAFLKEVSEE